MKKYLATLAVVVSTAASAGPYHHGWHHHRHHYYGGGWGWVAPAVIGGAVVYGLTRPAETVVVQPQPQVIVAPQNNCTPWREIQQVDGTIIRERTCYGLQ